MIQGEDDGSPRTTWGGGVGGRVCGSSGRLGDPVWFRVRMMGAEGEAVMWGDPVHSAVLGCSTKVLIIINI